MDDTWTRFWSDLVARLDGPMTFRLILQPTMAALSAFRDGVADAKAGRPPYFWDIFTKGHGDASQLLKEGWKAVLRIILLGAVMDVIYQWTVFKHLYPLELVVVVLLLAFVPYLLLRGPINRLTRRWLARQTP